MISEQEILRRAEQLAGSLSEREQTALETLCAAAKSAVEAKLCADASDADVAVVCGAAYLALSWLVQTQPAQFTAGQISVTNGGAGERAKLYAALSAKLLAPYVRAGEFAFLGVEA